MKICDLVSGVGRLRRSTAKLKEAWLEAKEHWNDKASNEFEKKYLQPIPPQLTLTVAAVHKLAGVLEQAERDCEDEQPVH